MIYDETLDGNLDLDDIKMCVMKRSGERVPFNLFTRLPVKLVSLQSV